MDPHLFKGAQGERIPESAQRIGDRISFGGEGRRMQEAGGGAWKTKTGGAFLSLSVPMNRQAHSCYRVSGQVGNAASSPAPANPRSEFSNHL